MAAPPVCGERDVDRLGQPGATITRKSRGLPRRWVQPSSYMSLFQCVANPSTISLMILTP